MALAGEYSLGLVFPELSWLIVDPSGGPLLLRVSECWLLVAEIMVFRGQEALLPLGHSLWPEPQCCPSHRGNMRLSPLLWRRQISFYSFNSARHPGAVLGAEDAVNRPKALPPQLAFQ